MFQFIVHVESSMEVVKLWFLNWVFFLCISFLLPEKISYTSLNNVTERIFRKELWPLHAWRCIANILILFPSIFNFPQICDKVTDVLQYQGFIISWVLWVLGSFHSKFVPSVKESILRLIGALIVQPRALHRANWLPVPCCHIIWNRNVMKLWIWWAGIFYPSSVA